MISNLYNEQMGNYLAKLAKMQTNIRTAMEKQTNADRIRSMTDEELAKFIYEQADCFCAARYGVCIKDEDTCRAAWLKWLKEEVKDV